MAYFSGVRNYKNELERNLICMSIPSSPYTSSSNVEESPPPLLLNDKVHADRQLLIVYLLSQLCQLRDPTPRLFG